MNVPEAEPPMIKLLPKRNKEVVAFSAGLPETDNLARGVAVFIPNRVLVLSQKRLALFWERTPAVPMYGTLPAVRPVERVVMVEEVERKLLEINPSVKVTIPPTVARVDEVDLNPLLVNSPAIVTLPPEVVMVDVPERPPLAVTQKGKLLTLMGEEVETEPEPLPVASVAQESDLAPLVERICPAEPSAVGQV